ncbi:hypothetical protein A7A76_00620 [Lysobacter enzymogenes]|uniref:hypothetical protein n=1 Tax=Lysobacter enzymogenes TaxID=69 RepID=UPI0019D1A968|nr:hypothetical protein [Lysobacter enzymogenes]MBN7138392.1 hypothetical protein [Lysobacter enzymogenes]
MPSPEEDKLARMLREFQDAHGSRPEPIARHMQQLLDTPEIKSMALEAIRRGNLEKLGMVDEPMVGGDYDANTKSLRMSKTLLTFADKQFVADKAAVTAAHELQHALDRPRVVQRDGKFDEDIRQTVAGAPPHDYTAALKSYFDETRQLEARASISAFNVAVDIAKRRDPNADLKQVYDVAQDNAPTFIAVDSSKQSNAYALKPGLAVDAGGKIDPGRPDNLETAARNYYDAAGYSERLLGSHLEYIRDYENTIHERLLKSYPDRPAPQIQVDTKALGVSGPLPAGIDDAGAPKPAPGVTRSLAPAAPAPAEPASDPRRADHPDHAYFNLLRGKLPESVPDNAVAHAMHQAKLGGMRDPAQVDPDQVAVHSGQVWIGGRTPGFRSSSDPTQAPPMAEVGAQLEASRLRSPDPAQHQAQEPKDAKQDAPRAPAPAGL